MQCRYERDAVPISDSAVDTVLKLPVGIIDQDEYARSSDTHISRADRGPRTETPTQYRVG